MDVNLGLYNDIKNDTPNNFSITNNFNITNNINSNNVNNIESLITSITCKPKINKSDPQIKNIINVTKKNNSINQHSINKNNNE